MDSTFDSTLNQARNGARNLKDDIAERASRLKDSASGEFKNLIDDVEDLISRVGDVNDPELVRLRDKVKEAVSSAREALNDGADKVRRSAQQVAGGTDDFVRENPWQALGIAALIGVAIGFLASRRS
jgi:ElaB/YqjD/DUF883 family membrane-anchored ribosome-binding protein